MRNEKRRVMPKRKPAARSTATKSRTGSVPARSKKTTPAHKTSASTNNYTAEYAEYLERYELYGEGRPRLSPSEFERYDDELLDLLALETEQGVLNDDQIIRLQELEYLLLDSES